jgi:hypothetical protein
VLGRNSSTARPEEAAFSQRPSRRTPAGGSRCKLGQYPASDHRCVNHRRDYNRVMKGVAAGVVFLMLLGRVASADILGWEDADGVRHYTNLKGEVPPQHVAEVVVDEQVWLPQTSPLAVAEEEPAPEPEPPNNTDDAVSRAYLAGLERALATPAPPAGDVYVSGPLAVTIAPPVPYAASVIPGYDWLPVGSYPFVTTSLVGPRWGAAIGRRPGAVTGRHPGAARRGFDTAFTRRFSPSNLFMTPAGPPPFGAAGPPPFGAAGPPPFGAAGPPPFGAAGPPPIGSADSRLFRVARNPFLP